MLDTDWPRIGDSAPSPVASRRHTRNFIFIVCGIAALGVLQSTHASIAPHTPRLPLYLCITALQLLFVWFIRKGVRSRGRSLLDLVGRNSLALSAVFMDLVLAIGFLLLFRGGAMLVQRMLGHYIVRPEFLLPVSAGESLLWIAVSVVAGCCEEIVFRGYLQRQLWAITGSFPIAVTLQALVFCVAHAYQGWFAAIATGVYGIAFGLLAAWRRSIRPGAFAHCLIDIIGGLGPR
jgi:membrane protease YdiL (CAAX protease family)